MIATPSTEVFACYSKVCAPPPAGRGGSSRGGGKSAGRFNESKKSIADSTARTDAKWKSILESRAEAKESLKKLPPERKKTPQEWKLWKMRMQAAAGL